LIGYLVDASALWHLFRTPGALSAREGHIAAGALHVCVPTRAEFLYSATGPAHRDEPADELDTLCGTAAVPESARRWVDSAQHRLTQRGPHRSAGAIDLLVCATAAHHDLTVLHVDNGFTTIASAVPDLREQDARR